MTKPARPTTPILRRAAVALLVVPTLAGAAPAAAGASAAGTAAASGPTRTDCSAWVRSEFRGLAHRACARRQGERVTSLIEIRNRTARTQVGAWIVKERTSPEGAIGSGSVTSRYRVLPGEVRSYTGTRTDPSQPITSVIVIGRIFREGEQIGRARVTADYT
ncbi:MAG: hypothetical protein JWN84_3961 [Nocardioides sp.]|nr:hypothetical protein [Nocardioides sp.]